MNSTTTWIVVGVGAALLALLLLLGSVAPETTTDSAATVPVSTSSVSTSSGGASYSYAGAPIVDAGEDVTVGERETIQLAGSGYDPAGGKVVYHWSAEGGLGFFENTNSPTTHYTAPSACDCEEYATLTLTVTNASGVASSDQMTVWVRDPLACPTETCVAEGESEGYYEIVPVDTCDPHSDVATCPATPSEPCESPCISEAPTEGDCPIPAIPCPCATGCDGDLGGPSLTFDPAPDHPKDRAKPSIVKQYPAKINEGVTVRLQGVVNNPTCQVVCYFWTADKGWFEDADTLQPIYHAPESDRLDGETVTIKLVLYDGPDSYSYEQIRMRIINTDPM